MRMITRLYLADLRRYLRRLWSYRFDTLGELALWLVAFPLLMVIFGSVAPNFGTDAQLASLIGFLVWNLCIGVLMNTTTEITTEAGEGTLEAVVLTPHSPLLLFTLRLVAAFTIQAVQTLILGSILVVLLGTRMTLAAPAPLLLGLTLVGTLGASLALGGIALVHKQVASVVSVVSLLALLATGALVPLNNLGLPFLLLKWFVPTAWGIDALRTVILHGATWTTLWADWTLVGLTVQSLILLGIGISLFDWGFRKAQQQGTLGTY
jgi:ABC-type multidrug transport system permease subunit